MYRGRYRARTKLNVYAIYCNGYYLGNVTAVNVRSAILIYCRSNGIKFARGKSYGECGMPIAYCSKSIYTNSRACGKRTKCRTHYVIPTNMGLMTGVPLYM